MTSWKTAGIALAAAALFTPSAFAAATKQVTREQRLRDMDPTMAKSQNGSELVPTGKGYGVAAKPGSNPNGNAKPQRGNGIDYHGGPVMLGTPTVHYIWYGNWSGNNASTILNNLITGLNGSGYEHINSTYYNGSSQHVSGAMSLGSSSNDNYSHGTSLSDSAIQAVVAATNPTDTNGIYLVLTSADVTASSGFCTQYCGWHTHGTINGRDIKYGFIGNPDRCPSSCAWQTTSPNGNAGADGMASIIAHETEEAISDPDLNAWYDRRGAENADKCAWTFGNTSTASNGSEYNVTLGGKQYLIQQNWVNASGGYCSMSY